MKDHSDTDEPSVAEDDCVVCGRWPAADREGMREMIDCISLRDDVCEECEMAFWRNIGFFDLFRQPTRH
jgi:hypothetical protein